MVLLRIIPLPSIHNLCDYLRTLFLPLPQFCLTHRNRSLLHQFFLLLLIVWDMNRHRCFDGLSLFPLDWRISEDGRAILGASVVSLAVGEGWIVRPEEKFCNTTTSQ